MTRFTVPLENGAHFIPPENIQPTENGYAGEAAEQLARFETFYADVLRDQQELAGKLEELRKDGQKNSVKFKELLVKKMNSSNILLMLKWYGIE